MNRLLLLAGMCIIVIAAGSFGQQKSERARAMIAALEDVKAGQRSSRVFLLSPLVSGPSGGRHDSVLLSEISSVALRVTAPAPPYVLDTFVLSIATPTRNAEGVYTVRAGGYLATMMRGACRIGGPSITYEVRCTTGECKATRLTQATGSGRCD